MHSSSGKKTITSSLVTGIGPQLSSSSSCWTTGCWAAAFDLEADLEADCMAIMK